jgi:uncharacterized protein YndB with AHSA1/START domain
VFGGDADRVRRQILLPAPRDEAWAAVTEPARLTSWLAPVVELDLRPGGAARFAWPDGSERHARILEIDRPRRISFEWERNPQGTEHDSSVVEITLADAPRGTWLIVVERRRTLGEGGPDPRLMARTSG